MTKTKAVEILESRAVPHEIATFDAIEFSAEEVSRKVGIPLESVFKTLVARLEHQGVIMALVPGNRSLDLARLAPACSARRADLVSLKELEPLTGYKKGGCSPLGAKAHFPVIIDETVTLHERVAISAGLRGMQILIAPRDLITATSAKLALIAGDL